jgi:hypothetical protein
LIYYLQSYYMTNSSRSSAINNENKIAHPINMCGMHNVATPTLVASNFLLLCTSFSMLVTTSYLILLHMFSYLVMFNFSARFMLYICSHYQPSTLCCIPYSPVQHCPETKHSPTCILTIDIYII